MNSNVFVHPGAICRLIGCEFCIFSKFWAQTPYMDVFLYVISGCRKEANEHSNTGENGVEGSVVQRAVCSSWNKINKEDDNSADKFFFQKQYGRRIWLRYISNYVLPELQLTVYLKRYNLVGKMQEQLNKSTEILES
ncbi:hypothetical protein JTE90_020077 [Oedothorax gibbosus]|uniref:Uncharacterized protein n=1 Tax=Oedothorax gibbosus TaxID=931172 RepID=A0AAV6UU82_9ARAC|nr:hypothetical protein JTE90_020077 [Oedothorax gibbosus]